MRSVRAAPAALAALALLATCAACSRGGPPERVFDGDRAFVHLREQVDLGPRAPGLEGHARALGYLRSHLEGRADRVTLHEFRAISPLDSSEMHGTNLVAVFGEDIGRRILFGAHWDTRARSDEEEDESKRTLPVPGANDGASGVAVLLEVATVLAAAPAGIGVDIVLFDAEDQGIGDRPETWSLGAAAFVRDHPDYRPAFAVIVDMVGRTGSRIPREGHSVLAAGPLVESIWRIGRERGLGVLADTLGAAVIDDHIPFLRAGIPAVDLIGLDDPDWHTTRDLPANCSAETLAEVGTLLLALVARSEMSLSP